MTAAIMDTFFCSAFVYCGKYCVPLLPSLMLAHPPVCGLRQVVGAVVSHSAWGSYRVLQECQGSHWHVCHT